MEIFETRLFPLIAHWIFSQKSEHCLDPPNRPTRYLWKFPIVIKNSNKTWFLSITPWKISGGGWGEGGHRRAKQKKSSHNFANSNLVIFALNAENVVPAKSAQMTLRKLEKLEKIRNRKGWNYEYFPYEIFLPGIFEASSASDAWLLILKIKGQFFFNKFVRFYLLFLFI